MKGIILAGGLGTRLRPLTNVINKNLLPIYNRPLIDFPLQTLVDAGIKEIMIISRSDQIGNFVRYLGSGHRFGVRIVYEIEERPLGTANILSYAAPFVGYDNCTVIYSDTIFLDNIKKEVQNFSEGAHVFVKPVDNPERYGIFEIKGNKITNLVEKPKAPKSNLANTGLYIFDPSVFGIIKKLKKSPRGEYELTDALKVYLKKDQLTYSRLKKAWLDAGTFEGMHRASLLIRRLSQDK